MSFLERLPIRAPSLVAAASAVLWAALAAPAAAQSTFIYAFSSDGRVSANGYPLDKMNSGGTSPDDETWRDLAVHGPDRWFLRGDGTLALNGEKIDDLAGDTDWRGIVVNDLGDFFALRKDGRVSGPAGMIHDYDAGSFDFLDIETDGTSVYVLKTNGGIFRVPEPDALIKFNGPPGEIDGSTGDGEATDTVWYRLKIDPVTGRMWALRRDGTLKSAEIPLVAPVDPDPGQDEASLPYDDGDDTIDPGDLYSDLAFDALGGWHAIRADGRLFDVLNQGPPLVDFPGGPGDDGANTYESVLAGDDTLLVLRSDGKIFRGVDTESIIDLKGDRYVGLVFGTELPNLDNVKNQPPVASKATITAPEGADVSLTVIAADRDLPADELVVDVVPETLPPGATWDAVAHVLSWPAAGPPGKYKVKITVDDGIAKPVNAVQTVIIKPLDDNVSKNVKPKIQKLKGAVALAALPFATPVAAFDLDGDPVDLQLDDTGNLPAGVSFDDVADVLSWDAPSVADAGTVSFKFLGLDGTAEEKRTIKVKVQTSLLAF